MSTLFPALLLSFSLGATASSPVQASGDGQVAGDGPVRAETERGIGAAAEFVVALPDPAANVVHVTAELTDLVSDERGHLPLKMAEAYL